MENDNYGKMKESHKTGVEAGVSEASLQVKSGKHGWSVGLGEKSKIKIKNCALGF